MKTRKSINYAYPSSPAAASLGMAATGCHYVAVSVFCEGASWSPSVAVHNAEGFASPTDPDLLACYAETEGEPCPYFLRHGNPHTLLALAALAPVSPARKSNRSAASRLAQSL